MKILIEKPPVWDRVHVEFTVDDSKTIYTYGDNIYNPANIFIAPEIIEHEKVHMKQQEQTEGGPKAWWDRYFADMGFRIGQEAEAYAAQFYWYCRYQRDRNKQVRYLWEIAGYLASPMYGVEMSHGDAMKLIRVCAERLV